jgi:hypothetical protein
LSCWSSLCSKIVWFSLCLLSIDCFASFKAELTAWMSLSYSWQVLLENQPLPMSLPNLSVASTIFLYCSKRRFVSTSFSLFVVSILLP